MSSPAFYVIEYPQRQETHEATLRAVHAWAHAHFAYVPDPVRWPAGSEGVAFNGDHWESDAELEADLRAFGRVRGDCDAFAKLCWKALRRLGIPSRLVLCQDENAGWHLVCEAAGWVLDNRQPVLVSNVDLADMGYRFHSMSGYAPGQQWTSIANA